MGQNGTMLWLIFADKAGYFCCDTLLVTGSDGISKAPELLSGSVFYIRV